MMMRLLNKQKSNLEKLLLRGAHYQFFFIAVLIILVSVTSGLAVFILSTGFQSPGEAIWWGFLRLSDPGYLGDDKGLVLAAVSTIVTVLGYVLFMGALIAIMTQWLNGTMRKLESGLTPIAQNNHVLILGWTNRTSIIIRELILSEGRVKRFLSRIGASKLHIVILADEVNTTLAHELKEELGTLWDPKKIIFRSGTPLRIEHLRRVDFLNASVIIMPGADFVSGGTDLIDTRNIKSLLSISNYGEVEGYDRFPLLVAEMFDARKIQIAKAAYKGKAEIIASDTLISRLIAQNVRHQGLSYIYSELLSHKHGNGIYIRECPQFKGKEFISIVDAFPSAILLGALCRDEDSYVPMLNPQENFRIREDDRLVFIARSYDDTEALKEFNPASKKFEFPDKIKETHPDRNILILGWNHKIPTLLREFDSYENERFHVDLVSLMPVEDREKYLSRYGLSVKNVKLRHLHADYISVHNLQRIDPEKYDNIIFLGSSRVESGEDADARTILGYLLLKQMIPADSLKPEILIELMDPENEKLFEQRKSEVLISPVILSHILAHVALRRDLNLVFDELFTVGGAEIYFRTAKNYDLTEQNISFKEIEAVVSQKGEIALGIRSESIQKSSRGGIYLNPPRDSGWELTEKDDIVVLTTYV